MGTVMDRKSRRDLEQQLTKLVKKYPWPPELKSSQTKAVEDAKREIKEACRKFNNTMELWRDRCCESSCRFEENMHTRYCTDEQTALFKTARDVVLADLNAAFRTYMEKTREATKCPGTTDSRKVFVRVSVTSGDILE